MPSLSVALSNGRSYPIFIGSKVLNQPELLAPYISGKQFCIVTNTTVAELYEQPVRELLTRIRPDALVSVVHLPDGESYKTLETLNRVFDTLLQERHNRKTTLIALGGGVVGDMTGFAAATYQRGVDFVQIPTTLLSQVDSSVGGKTGVNHPLGKNMIGAFYQPRAVLIDTDVLRTLPDRELAAGLAEVIKYGLIADADFFVWLEANIDALNARDPEALTYAIRRSCEIKADVVGQDEFEGGIRAILNLGHTYGHAIETEMGYGVWLHGEAVAAGMVMACELSVDLGWLQQDILDRARSLIARARLPVAPPKKMTAENFLAHMSVDKKVLDGSIRLVLLQGCGKAVVTSEYDADALLTQLRRL
ncbi:MAG: 3-dehydroquinate synthase [Cellvibrionaceae bacterium]|nr:3-dehydroquinate synthase [Cellvibrionaceae bacterium]